MPRRIESPSSINTYKQCPRKYYYQYIEKLPTKPSIHLVRGKIAHTVLEEFFKNRHEGINENNYEARIKNFVQLLLVETWKKNKLKFDELKITQQQLNFYFDETMMMMLNFADHFIKRVKKLLEDGLDIKSALVRLTPLAEEKFVSEEKSVMGFIDAIEQRDGKTYIMDYKTSKGNDIKDAYRLQLAIYALLYYERYDKLPHKVGIFFLKDTEKFIDADNSLMKEAAFEIEQMHASTISGKKADYPMKPGPLCKWSSGQCDFYEKCFPE